MPDLTPLAGWVLGGIALFIALLIGGTVSGAWETVLLYLNRVPFSPTASVTDPIFGRDIGFFLFELPFLRLVQGLFNGIVLTAIVLTLARYIVGASRSGLVFSTPIRVHLAVLGGLFLLSVAFGYQLDKLELVYSTRGVATGVSFTDQNAQFLAFDVLTFVSGIAGALLVGGGVHADDLAARADHRGLVRRVAGHRSALPRSRPAPHGRAQQVRPGRAIHRQQHRDDPARLRPRRLGQHLVRGGPAADDGADHRRSRHVRRAPGCGTPRPLRTTLDQLQTVRRYYDFTGVDTDRYVINGVPRQVMLSARELALEQNPNASGWVNQRIRFTHGVGAAMVPVNEVGSEGQPRLLISNLPPTSASGAPTIDPARSGIYFGERPSSYVVVGAQQNEFDYPTGESDSEGSIGTETRWTGTSGVALDNTLMRLLFAARFRDLDLLISNQVTLESQLLFHRSINDRLSLIAPFLRLDKDPYLVIDDAGRMVYVQDAYTTSDRFPNAQGFDAPAGFDLTGLRNDDFDYIRNSVKITVDAYDGTMHFYVNDPDDPIIRAYQGVFPDALRADVGHAGRPHSPTSASRRTCSTSRPTCSGGTTSRTPQQFFGADDLWTVPTQTSEQTLPSEAYYVEMRLPNESGVEFLLLQPMVADRPPEHDRLGRGADGCARRTGRCRSTASRRTRRSSGPPRSRPGSIRTRSSAPRSRSGTSPAATSSAEA